MKRFLHLDAKRLRKQVAVHESSTQDIKAHEKRDVT